LSTQNQCLLLLLSLLKSKSLALLKALKALKLKLPKLKGPKLPKSKCPKLLKAPKALKPKPSSMRLRGLRSRGCRVG
jgi:hypothetical protein